VCSVCVSHVCVLQVLLFNIVTQMLWRVLLWDGRQCFPSAPPVSLGNVTHAHKHSHIIYIPCDSRSETHPNHALMNRHNDAHTHRFSCSVCVCDACSADLPSPSAHLRVETHRQTHTAGETRKKRQKRARQRWEKPISTLM